MSEWLPQLAVVAVLIILNAAFAGSEMALISLREGQLQRLEQGSAAGKVLALLARDPNRFLATIQIGITLAGFMASATAAVALADPLTGMLGFLGRAADAVAVVLVTLALAFVTLVFGELAPKRVAMQRAERWGLLAARPLAGMAKLTRPAVWLLSVSTDIAVRVLGGDPSRQREDVTEEELRDMVAAQTTFTPEQRTIISGAFEIGERTLRAVVVPRGEVTALQADQPAEDGLHLLVAAGHSRAPVILGDLDHTEGLVHLRDLIDAAGTVADHARPVPAYPEGMRVVEALRLMQRDRHQLALVTSEYGGLEGIVTLEDLVEELVGEIYDESDRDIARVVRELDGAVLLLGSFPVHDLSDLGIDLPESEDYTTVAGLVLSRMGRLPDSVGTTVEAGSWTLEVVGIEGRVITHVRVRPRPAPGDDDAD